MICLHTRVSLYVSNDGLTVLILHIDLNVGDHVLADAVSDGPQSQGEALDGCVMKHGLLLLVWNHEVRSGFEKIDDQVRLVRHHADVKRCLQGWEYNNNKIVIMMMLMMMMMMLMIIVMMMMMQM